MRACICWVAFLPASAATLMACSALAKSWRWSTAAWKASRAGTSVSTSVLSPTWALPMPCTFATAAAKASPNSAASSCACGRSVVTKPMKNFPYSGPIEPPMSSISACESCSSAAGRLCAPRPIASRRVAQPVNPLLMLMPWSPSPIRPSISLRYCRLALIVSIRSRTSPPVVDKDTEGPSTRRCTTASRGCSTGTMRAGAPPLAGRRSAEGSDEDVSPATVNPTDSHGRLRHVSSSSSSFINVKVTPIISSDVNRLPTLLNATVIWRACSLRAISP